LRKASQEVMREGRRYLKSTTRNPNEDLRRICESMGKHLPVTKDVTEVILRDLSERARKYFFETVIAQLLDRYILTFDNLSDHMYKVFGVCIVLEDHYDLRDCIDGVYQIYEKTHLLREQEDLKSYS